MSVFTFNNLFLDENDSIWEFLMIVSTGSGIREQCLFCQESVGGWRKYEARPLVEVNTLRFLSDSVGWVTWKTSGP